MCLLVIAWGVHPRYPLLIAGNRDELHARPAAGLHWWDDPAGLLAGRDLEAGGTWLGVASSGRVGVVTNAGVGRRTVAGTPSRGAFVPRFAVSRAAATHFAASLASEADTYAGFNLLLHDGRDLVFASNWPSFATRVLPPGVYGLSNDVLDVPWPKVIRTRQRFAALLADEEPKRDAMLAAFTDTAPASAAELAAPGREQDLNLTPPFLLDPVYGTRCTTLVLVAADGTIDVEEQRYDATGLVCGTRAERFRTSSPAPVAGTAIP